MCNKSKKKSWVRMRRKEQSPVIQASCTHRDKEVMYVQNTMVIRHEVYIPTPKRRNKKRGSKLTPKQHQNSGTTMKSKGFIEQMRNTVVEGRFSLALDRLGPVIFIWYTTSGLSLSL